METLLAQADPVAVESVASGLFKLVAEYGPSGAFFAVLTFLCVKYGPAIIETHLAFVKNTDANTGKIASALDTLSETHASEKSSHTVTQKALGHMAEGHRKQSTDPEARVHFDRAIDALE